MFDKIQNKLFKFRTYWSKPPKGYYVSYKEFAFFALGGGGSSLISVLVGSCNIAVTANMMAQHFKMTSGVAFLLATVIGSIIALIRAPILSMIIDNSNDTKGKGKFKPLLMWSALAGVSCLIFVPFIPASWMSIVPDIFKFSIPPIPLFGINTTQNIELSVGVLVMFVLVQVGTFFHTLFSQAMIGIEQTISPVAQERANIISFKSIFTNLPGSVMNIISPLIAAILYGGDLKNINLYRIIFPIAAIGGILGLISMSQVKERVMVTKDYKAKVKFGEGAKALSKNKYFWIITLFNIFVGVRTMSNIVTWIQWSYPDGSVAKTVVAFFNTTLLMSILIIGMATAPYFIKKLGKKNLMIFSSIGFAFMVGLQLLCYQNRVLILIASLFQNIFGGFAFVSGIMITDILDYQQWRNGKRLEGFWQNYSGFISTILGLFTGALIPLFLSFAGVDFSMPTEDVMTSPDTALRNSAFFYISLLGLIGSIATIIPLLFYDLTEKKHANYVDALKIRVATSNYKAGYVDDNDIISLKEVVEKARLNQNQFVLDEISKFDNIDLILSSYDEAYMRSEEKNRKESVEEFQRDIELEYKKIRNKMSKAKKKSLKSKDTFDEDALLKQFKSVSRLFRYFNSEELSKYDTLELINSNIETVFDLYTQQINKGQK